jgi:hypothetical protein
VIHDDAAAAEVPVETHGRIQRFVDALAHTRALV